MFFIAIIGAVFIGCSSDDDISKKEYDSSLFGELKCFTVDDKYIYIDDRRYEYDSDGSSLYLNGKYYYEK